VSPILGVWASAQQSAFVIGDYESIATVTASGSSQELTFSSIPQTYTHLEIRGIGQASYSSNDYGTIGVRLNGDSGSNYTRHALRGNGSVVAVTGLTSTSFADAGDGAYLNTGSTVGASVISILDYTNTNKNTTVRGFSGVDNNGIGAITLGSGLWINTAAVTSVTLYQQNANFTTNSQFALYGIKG
jgi:hypothetical protein